MKTRSICLILSILALLATNPISGATVPAGSSLTVRSLQTITSTDVPGTRFTVELLNNVGALHPGIKMTARVVTSRRTHHSNQRLTVDLMEATVRGHSIPIKTTGAVQLDNTRFKTKNDVSVSRAGYSVPAGRVIHFRLAQPIQY
jgi:hypothetical protein